MQKNDFEKLKEKWYKKLADKGFEDIEQDEYHLKTWATSRRITTKTGYETKQKYNSVKEEYYRLAGFFLHDNKFRSKMDEFIWQKHSEGLTLREISNLLIKKNPTYSKDKINRIIKELSQAMKEKYKVVATK